MVQAFGPITLGLAALSLTMSAAGFWMTIHLAQKIGVMDVPNVRSSHSVPTPRMGGMAMVIAAVFSLTSWLFLTALIEHMKSAGIQTSSNYPIELVADPLKNALGVV